MKAAIIYALIDPRSPERVRYIGKAVNVQRRLYAHIFEARCSTADTYKVRWMRVLLREGIKPQYVVLETVPPGAKWQDREQYWVFRLRKEGHELTNGTDGGEGAEGKLVSAETRRRISEARRGYTHSPVTLARMAAARVGRTLSEEHKRKLGDLWRGRTHSIATKEKLRLITLAQWQEHKKESLHGLGR